MKNKELKNCLDDAVSGIGENPWLLSRVLSRAESMEDTPVKKKFTFGTVQVVLTIILLMSVGIASFSSLNRTDSQTDNNPVSLSAPAISGMEAETEHARLKLESPVYDGTSIYLNWCLENKNPEVPMWCWAEKFSVNGIEFDFIDYNLEEEWLPGEYTEDGIAWHEWLTQLPKELIGAETIHVEMKINTSRPVRPWKMLDTEDAFREELESLIAEGYYVIPAYREDEETYWPEGYFEPEEDLNVCPNGWTIAVSGGPLPDDTMGDIIVETLDVSFDAVKPEPGNGLTLLQTQDAYEDEYCTAVFEKAEGTSLALYLTVRMKPKDNHDLSPRYWALEWKGLTDQKGIDASLTPSKKEYPSPDHEGETVCELCWEGITPEILPDTIYLTTRLKNYELVRFPIQVRSSGT